MGVISKLSEKSVRLAGWLLQHSHLHGDLGWLPSPLQCVGHFTDKHTLAFIVPADQGGNEFMIPVSHSPVIWMWNCLLKVTNWGRCWVWLLTTPSAFGGWEGKLLR